MKRLKIRMLIWILCIVMSGQTVSAAQLVVPGGQVIGLEIQDQTVTVAAFDETLGQAAKTSGMQVGDKIVAVNGKKVRCVRDVKDALNQTDGHVQISLQRCGVEKTVQIQPQITRQGPRLGVYLKEGITGVGTVTWYEPTTGKFGALGHGVNDLDGRLIAMERGHVYDASVISVKTGKIGNPGQLMSSVSGSGIVGKLEKNTPQGIFGTAKLSTNEELLPVGESEDVHTGAATIRSTVAGCCIQEYSVEIVKIYPNSGASGKNMLLKVTDSQLLSATGGIVQGMSGSPIIQNGKLIGAVTHVLVNDPTTGYGIFIENMLDAAA